jgi:hypothetical protein
MRTLLLGILFATNCLAWGPTGHRVVGEVAEKHLKTDVYVRILKISKGESLSRMANWADEIKSEPQTYSHTFNWHYTDWADDAHEHNEDASSGVLLKSINDQIAILKNQQATDESKLQALRFIIHLVGDLHQPLHVGNGLDMGGNNCRVLFHGKPTNLHSVWDSEMIDFTKLSFIEMTSFIAQGKQLADIIAWRKGTVLDWALESKQLRATLYPADVVARTEPMSTRLYCRKDVPVTTAEMPRLSFEYSYRFMPIVEKRLYQAGVRLAVLLNEALK